MTKARSEPPRIPNFTYRSWLGGGGFADVFLYDQVRPARAVAVKVLRTTTLDSDARRAFDTEADLMAKVSAHPYIVTIFGADVAPDGRPYLVMEYYPKPHFGRRVRESSLTVPEVLRLGVRVASAVETAHRAGILHRDIKPANILVNEFDRPGLSDFGIAGAREGTQVAENQGLTVPYASPEVLLGESHGDELGDIYSLAATLYACLAGRAPFQTTDSSSGASQAMVHRTLSTPVPPIGRPEVPPTLELLLSQAMAKDPAHRPGSAAAFGRALQGVERELRLAVTDFELAGQATSAPVRRPDDEDGTRASQIQVVRPTELPTGPSVTPPQLTDPGAALPLPAPPTDTIARRRPAVPADPVEAASPAGVPEPMERRTLLTLVAAGAVVVLATVGVLLASRGGDGGGGATSSTTSPPPTGLDVPSIPDPPTDLVVEVDGGTARISWEPGEAEPDDSYLVLRLDGSRERPVAEASEPTAQVHGLEPGERVCFTVVTNRGQRSSERAIPACTR